MALIFCLLSLSTQTEAKRRAPAGGRVAVVIDERLAALRDAPDLSAHLLQRLSRGRMVAVAGAKRTAGGVVFYRVAVTSRTSGWLQADAVVSPAHAGDDARLWRLIQRSDDFERIARARIFLDQFTTSPLRPTVLLAFGDTAESAAEKLSREALRRLDGDEMTANGAPLFSYFLNYHGLDRYNRNGVTFVFDLVTKRFHYDGASWREILRRHPHSPEANEARTRLATLASVNAR